jgi:hypothetical protein
LLWKGVQACHGLIHTDSALDFLHETDAGLLTIASLAFGVILTAVQLEDALVLEWGSECLRSLWPKCKYWHMEYYTPYGL